MCATIVLESSEEWAIWNDCNGVFEVFNRRARAQEVLRASYAKCDARVVPVRVFVEPEDNRWLRVVREDDHEGRRCSA